MKQAEIDLWWARELAKAEAEYEKMCYAELAFYQEQELLAASLHGQGEE